MQGNELRRHLSDTHNISEHLVTEEVLSVETRVQTEPVTSMTIIEQVGKVHVLPLLQVQVDSAQVTVEQVHPDLLQDSQVHDSHISELPEQVQVSYLEVGRIQTEEGTEVHVEELHVERVNQMPVEVQTELLEADLDQVTPEIMNQEEGEPSQKDAAEAARDDLLGLNNKMPMIFLNIQGCRSLAMIDLGYKILRRASRALHLVIYSPSYLFLCGTVPFRHLPEQDSAPCCCSCCLPLGGPSLIQCQAQTHDLSTGV